MGGCSAHNGCAAIWGHRADYDAWAAAGNPGWSTEELIPLFREVSNRMQVRIPTANEITPFHRRMLDGAAAIGIPLVDDLNDLDEPVGMAASPANIRDGIRWNGAFAYVDPNRERGNLRVLADTLVDRVVLEGDHAVGVEAVAGSSRQTVYAPTIVLAGGTYNSPTILMRSGVGSPDQLRPHGIAAFHDLPGVGQNLHDHPAVTLRMTGSDELRRELTAWAESAWFPEEQTIAKLRSSRCAEAFDLHIYPEGGPYADGRTGWVFQVPVACMDPRSRGELRLRSADPEAAPILDHNYLGDREGHDLAVLTDGVQIARGLIVAANTDGRLGEPMNLPDDITVRADLEAWVRAGVGHYYHPAGTCKMGPASDPTAVVDAVGKVHGLDGLYVADCSVMPQVPRANTNIPAAVVGVRIGGWLATS
jgi:choline dehydrogenase